MSYIKVKDKSKKVHSQICNNGVHRMLLESQSYNTRVKAHTVCHIITLLLTKYPYLYIIFATTGQTK